MSPIKFIIAIGLSICYQGAAYGQPKPQQQYLQQVGTLDSLYSETLQDYRKIYVQLPENYNPAQNEKYPVVFILDGEVFLPTLTNVHRFYSGGFFPEMILVGIANEIHRMRDLTTSKVTQMYGRPFEQDNGGAANFHKFIASELIPYIEDTYPVTNFRTLIGHSYGGLFTLYSLLYHPAIFSNYIAIDPSLDWDDQHLLKAAEALIPSQTFKNKSVFMSLSGQLHMQDATITLENVMQDTTDFTLFSRSNMAFVNLITNNAQNGLDFNWKFYPKDLHGTVALPSIRDGLISVFEWFQMEHTDEINNFDTPKERLMEIVKYRQQKLKAHFGYAQPPYPEELLTMSGYMNMDMGQPEKANMYLEFALKYYPQSANAHAAMADYYESTNNTNKALLMLTKAFDLSGDTSYKERLDALKKKK